jgi:hypothetical protein
VDGTPSADALASADFEELVNRLWIEEGAISTCIIPATGEFQRLPATTRTAQTEPLPPPTVGTGVQLWAPHQICRRITTNALRQLVDFINEVPPNI